MEETLVRVVGKLRSFDERLILMAFNIHEISDPKMADIHVREARLAQLYYEKVAVVLCFGNVISASYFECDF